MTHKVISAATRVKISRSLMGNRNAFKGRKLTTREKVANINNAKNKKRLVLSDEQLQRRAKVAQRLRSQARKEEGHVSVPRGPNVKMIDPTRVGAGVGRGKAAPRKASSVKATAPKANNVKSNFVKSSSADLYSKAAARVESARQAGRLTNQQAADMSTGLGKRHIARFAKESAAKKIGRG